MSFWADFRTSVARKNVTTGNPIVGFVVNAGSKLYNFHKLRRAHEIFNRLKRDLESLRPKKINVRRVGVSKYTDNFNCWYRLHEFFLAAVAAFPVTASATIESLPAAERGRAISQGEDILKRMASDRNGSAAMGERDRNALDWKQRFSFFVKNEWIPFFKDRLPGAEQTEVYDSALDTVDGYDTGAILTDLTPLTGPTYYGHSVMVLRRVGSSNRYSMLDYVGTVEPLEWRIFPHGSHEEVKHAESCSKKYAQTNLQETHLFMTRPNYLAIATKVIEIVGKTNPPHRVTGSVNEVALALKACLLAMGLAAASVGGYRLPLRCPEASLGDYLAATDPSHTICSAFSTNITEVTERYEVLRARLVYRLQRVRKTTPQPHADGEPLFPDAFFCSRVVIFVWQSALCLLTDVAAARKELIDAVMPLNPKLCSPRAILRTLNKERFAAYWSSGPINACPVVGSADRNRNQDDMPESWGLWRDSYDDIVSRGSPYH